MNRGVDRQDIVWNDDDRRSLLGFLGKHAERQDVAVLAFALMSNHFHLIVETGGNDLSAMMQSFQGGYARAFNTRTKRSGHLFEERFTSVPITDDAQMVQAVRYVHRNPVVVTGVSRITEYRWASLRASIGLGVGPAWLRTDMLRRRVNLAGHLQHVQAAQPSDRLPVHWNPPLRPTSLVELDDAIAPTARRRLRRLTLVLLAETLRCASPNDVADFLGVTSKTVRNLRAEARALHARDPQFSGLCEVALRRLG